MLITTGHRKVQTDTKKAYRRQQQYKYHCYQCQLGHVTPGNALLISVCILMLPMVQLSAEHVQLATKYHANPINQSQVDPHHMNISHTLLVPSSLSNLLPTMVLQNSAVRSCSLPASSHFSICYILSLSSGLGRMVGVMFSLLLLLSGDIETNPGPVGQQLSDIDLPVVMEELNKVCVKWYDIGMMLRVRFNGLDAIKEQYSNPSDCLRETLKMWLKIYPPHPVWSNVVDALRSDTVGETKLAADLEQKYCSTQDTSVAATHHPVSVAASQAHILETTLPQFMDPLSQPPVFFPPYSMPPQPHPSHSPLWSAPHYYPPPNGYQMSAQLLPPPPSATAYTATPPTVHFHVPPAPTLVTSSYSVPTLMTSSLPHPVPPSSPLSLITDSTPPDTPPTPQPPTPPPEHTGPANTHPVEQQVEKFEKKFHNLVDKAYQEMHGKMEPSVFLSCVTCLPVSARTQHRSFIKDNLANIPPSATLVNIWCILNLYWDFLNYGLLEHVIINFGSEDLKEQMQDYINELSTFKQRTRLCDFIESWPCRDDGPPEDSLKKVVVKMRHDWSQCTLQDVESFKKALIHKFFLPEFDILLQKAEKGCVCVTWLTSPSIATLLQQNLANIETEFFKERSIDAVTIDGQDVYLTPVSSTECV